MTTVTQTPNAKKPWGGVFREATDPRVEKFTESVSSDQRLAAYDVQGSQAHTQMLAAIGILTAEERDQIIDGLSEIGADISSGQFKFHQELEDVHMNVEQALIDRIGDVGRKLHTGRSRNDQISTDLRLWIRNKIDHITVLITDLQRAFVGRGEQDQGVILPGYTHLQRAQPVLAVHYWLAYCEKLQRDRGRLLDCRRRVNQLPLGTAALAGTTIAVDRQMVADLLGFEGVLANSLDSSGARDFVIEFASCLTLIAEHLSSLAEEWILWSTSEFNFLKLPQAFCTGSSIMPQKINPDVLELVRGKTGRVVGNLTSLLVLVKGLPLAYNRDLQEDKLPVFDSADTVAACLELLAPLVAGAELNRTAIADQLEDGYLDATTLMESLSCQGVPQRTAHEIIGRLVALALDLGVPLRQLPIEHFTAAHPSLDGSVYEILGAQAAVEAFRSYGSTNPAEVEKQWNQWKKNLSED